MTKIKYFLGIFFYLFFFTIKPAFAQNYEPKIFVQYHLWYTKEDVLPGFRGGSWAVWSQNYWSIDVIGGVDPTHFLSPWRRVTISRLGLPITGLYSSQNNLDVIKYHFQLVKEAGIDGLFASVYDGGWQSIFRNHLEIAKETGIKIAQEIYHGVTVDKPSNPEPYRTYPTQANGCKISRKWKIDQMTGSIKPYKNDSTFLRIEGKPAVWIANGQICSGSACQQIWQEWFPDTDCPVPGVIYSWGDVQELRDLLAAVEQKVGEPIYVIMTSQVLDHQGLSYADIPQIGKIATMENISVFWGLFGEHNQISVQLNQADRLRYEQEYRSRINTAKNSAGNKLSAHVYPAFDERGVFPTNAERGSGYNKPRAVITRDGNGMYEKNDGFLKAALDLAKENNLWVFLESWNDWGEQHQVEPGFAFNNFLYHQDYFSPLRRIADFKGIANPNFSFPNPLLLDSPLVKYCRHKQFEGERVKLKGKFGFSKTADKTNGIVFGTSYLNDYLSYKDPSWEGATRWEALVLIPKAYNGQLKEFEVDITSVLDTPAIVFGIESSGNPEFDQVHFTEFKLVWYGQEVDLLENEKLSKFNWHSQVGGLSWSTEGANGTAIIKTNSLLETGETYVKTLYLHPNFNIGGDTFIHAGVDWMNLESFIPHCDLRIPGDADNNGRVGPEDLKIWFSNFLRHTSQGLTEADFNQDAKVNTLDFGIWLKNFNR